MVARSVPHYLAQAQDDLIARQVRRGQVLGRCGNSGNSSEPHLHFQLMDHPHHSVAAGLPFTFEDAHRQAWVPHGGELVEARGDEVAATSPPTGS